MSVPSFGEKVHVNMEKKGRSFPFSGRRESAAKIEATRAYVASARALGKDDKAIPS
jgi:hypothetical protein